jgi:hypothetical protein
VTPLAAWLGDLADRVTLVTGEDAYSGYRDAFPRVYAVPDYSTNTIVEPLLAEICRQRPISTVVHVTEDDVLRCARLRDSFSIPGLRYEQALPWRDKFEMKRCVSAAGVSTPAFAVPVDLPDARRFADEAGYPFVVKPRLGFASRGVTLVRDGSRLAACAAQWDPADVMLESYVPGDVFHVDGFTHDGKVLHMAVSRYVNNCLSFHDCLPLGSVQQDRAGEEFGRFADLTERVVAALPALDFCPFHLEAFQRPDTGELVFCEVACRLGGAHIMETSTYSMGVNPAELWIRHQVGLEDGSAMRFYEGDRRYGWLLIPPREGRLVEIRTPAGVPFIKDFIVKTTVPRVFDGAHGSTDSVVAFVVEGGDSAEVEGRLDECIRLTDDLTEWESIDGRI